MTPECQPTTTDVQDENLQPQVHQVYRSEILHPVHAPDVCRKAAMKCPSGAPARPVRVLIGDPDEYLLESYRDHLEQYGVEVLTATTALECVERLRECAPDVLVLEPSLPWGWGDGVLAMMHEEPDIPLVPVIVLTYGRDRGVLYRLAPFKIDDYQVKPLGARRLAQRIRSLLACRRDMDAPVAAGAERLGGAP